VVLKFLFRLPFITGQPLSLPPAFPPQINWLRSFSQLHLGRRLTHFLDVSSRFMPLSPPWAYLVYMYFKAFPLLRRSLPIYRLLAYLKFPPIPPFFFFFLGPPPFIDLPVIWGSGIFLLIRLVRIDMFFASLVSELLKTLLWSLYFLSIWSHSPSSSIGLRYFDFPFLIAQQICLLVLRPPIISCRVPRASGVGGEDFIDFPPPLIKMSLIDC